jgi:hypothetical protein
MNISILEFLRSLGFGSLFGSGLTGLAYTIFYKYFSPSVSLRDMLIIGGLLGAGLHRMIDHYIFNNFFHPISSFIAFYSKLIQLSMLRRRGIISRRHANKLLKELTDKYFMAKPQPEKAPRLPPAND